MEKREVKAQFKQLPRPKKGPQISIRAPWRVYIFKCIHLAQLIFFLVKNVAQLIVVIFAY